MKRKALRMRIKIGYEPNRFAQDNLANAYETLCPDNKTAIGDSQKSDIALPKINQSKSKRKRQ